MTNTQIKALIGELWGITAVGMLATDHFGYAAFCVLISLWQTYKVRYSDATPPDDDEHA